MIARSQTLQDAHTAAHTALACETAQAHSATSTAQIEAIEQVQIETTLLDLLPWLVADCGDHLAFEWSVIAQWLDPLHSDDFYHEFGYYAEDEDAYNVMRAMRDTGWIDIYDECVQAYWSCEDTEDYWLQVSAIIHPMHPVEGGHLLGGELWPHVAIVGADLYSSDFWTGYEEYQPFFEMLGYKESATDGTYDCWRDHRASYEAVMRLIASLESTTSLVHDNIAMFLRWLVNQTGNTFTDVTYEEYFASGFEPPYWDALAHLYLVQNEADQFYDMAQAGGRALLDDPFMFKALRQNYMTLYLNFTHMEEFDNDTSPTVQWRWPQYCGQGVSGLTNAQRNHSHLQLWRDS